MKKQIALLCALFLFALQLQAVIINTEKDSITNSNKLISKDLKTRSFKDLDAILNSKKLHYNPLVSEFDKAYVERNFPLDSVTISDLTEAQGVMNLLEESQNFVDLLSPDEMITFPVGIKKVIGNITYVLGISSARITPQYSEVTAFVKITTPQLDAQGNQQQLFFGANNIKLSHQGGIYGDANLVLLGDVPIPVSGGKSLVILKGGFDMKTGDVENLTYVTVNCSGFKELGIKADVEFSRTILEPVDEVYNVIPGDTNKVTGSFQTIVGDWNDILVEINLPAFQLTKKDSSDGTGIAGLVFELNKAVFDFSDLRNSENVQFPTGYDQYLIAGNEELWRGVYVKTLRVILPKQFQKRSSEERITFEASNLLIDGMGVSGEFSVDNILSIDEGSASKWQFSVDHIEANFIANNLTKAGFEGRIVLPITKELTAAEIASDSVILKQKSLSYSAIIDPVQDEYALTVTTQDDLSFDVFKAKATILENSYVELKVSDGKFRPRAVLHGNLAIRGSNSTSNPDKATIDFKGVTFQNLQLQTESPYFQADYMGYNGDMSLLNFPVTISEIAVVANDTEASLMFAIDVNMMSSGFAGGTDLKVVGKMADSSGLQKWEFEKIEVGRISLEADLGAVKFKGFVDIKDDDPVYGDGFYGELEADFNSINVTATAWFGKTDFRYWYVDAYADLSGMTTPPTIGVAQVNGFGGGAYYRMEKKQNPEMQIYDGTPLKTPGPPSGMDYVPDSESGIGFRAMVGFALGNEKAFNGKVGFEMAFNRYGGLNRVLFFGEAHIMKALDFKFGDKFKDKLGKMQNLVNDLADNAAMESLKESNLVDYSKEAFPQDGLTFDAGIDANFSMEMDFKNKVFHSEMEIYVNTPGGFFGGIGPNGRAGWAVFHTGPDGWYIHAGTPTDRIGLKLGIGSFALQASTYLMIGDKIPGSPPPPAIVAEILGIQDLQRLDYMRDLNALGDGKGFAFGMDLSLDTGDMNFLIFYARFQAGIGFDIMVKDYGETACKGSGQIGINGWYANGQAYAYLQGELGINLNLFLIKKKIPIIKAGAAVLLQAKLPNPGWFRGYVGGHYNLLGGLVKGKFRFKLELGEECEIIGGAPLGGLKMISDITPVKDSNDVDVFTVPQIAFNVAINKAFELEDDNGVKTYRILLDELSFVSEGNNIDGILEWNDSNDAVNFISSDVLPQNSSIKIYVKVKFQEKKSGTWQTLMHDGKVAQEIEEVTFTTGEAPSYIPFTNIEYCYPVINQNNFYQEETKTGYIKLKQGQPYLFTPNTDWVQHVKYMSNINTQIVKEVSYNQIERKVSFGIPTLINGKDYALSIISFPPGQEIVEGNQEVQYTSQDTGQEGNTIEILNNQAQTVVQAGVESEVIVYNLTTSSYNTFKEKISAINPTRYYLEPISTVVHALQIDREPSERFSLLELNGGKYTGYKPLISPEAVLDDDYYKNTIYQLIYRGYPLESQFTVNRDVNKIGIPPKKAITALTWYSSYLENDPTFSMLDTRFPYRYYLPSYYREDFADIQYKIVNKYTRNLSQYQSQIQKYNYIINGSFPAIYSGDYKVKMKYILPDGKEGSNAIINFNNPY